MSESDKALPVGSLPLAESLSIGASPIKTKVEFKGPQPIVIELADGRKIGMAVPKISLSMNLATILANCTFKPEVFELERNRVRSLLYITDIDGVAEPKIADPIMRAALEQKIGDIFLDDVFVKWAENFASVGGASLSTVKKS